MVYLSTVCDVFPDPSQKLVLKTQGKNSALSFLLF